MAFSAATADTINLPTADSLPTRRFQRVKINVLGRYMLASQREYPCQVINMSPGDVALIAPVSGDVGERVIVYLDQIGRIEGEIVRQTVEGFALTINATPRKRDKLASQLTWLANRLELNLAEDRRHERMVPENPMTQLTTSDGKVHKCLVIDVSLSGAAIRIPFRPPIGSRVVLGRMQARVVRHMDEGIAVEFATVQSHESLKAGIQPAI
ncbi:MAG: pilus assembly protein PilZ [Hyphomicrobiales bacterium]|nr:MAG: pilus assembly protein PilZ [Hyphomicrobiales bacterium]